jgi:type I restriction enzyme, S subunit
MSYKKVHLSEICTIEKGATGITKAIEGEYPMITMAEARTSHNEYQFDTKAVLIPLVSSSGHGHASMKRIHYQEGKFAVGSILCALVPKNEDVVNARFLYNYLHFQRESILVPLMRGAANVSLSIKSISSVEINLPPIETQISINKLVDDFKLRQDIFQTELKTQSNLLSKLRQAYLQEAVMGKLTEPSQDNAQTLLKAIKSQKAELIKQGKLRKEKPLAPIKPEEIPFKIPDNWVWCRLGEICDTITKGSSPKWQGVQYVDSPEKGILFITSKNVDSFKIDLSNVTYVEAKFNEIEPRSVLKKGDLLTNIVGASIGRTALYNLDFIANINQAVCILRIEHEFINKSYLLNLLNSSFVINQMFESQFAPGRANLSMGDIATFPIPLPPLSEQKAIVAKVEGLLGNISLLESENKAQQIEVQRLMGAVLQEAFGGQ